MSSALAGFLYWRAGHHAVKVATHAVIVADVSDSTTNEHASVLGLAETYLSKPKLTKGSTLTVLMTGDDKSASEPRLVAKHEVPFSRRALEGKSAILKRKREILNDLETQTVSEIGKEALVSSSTYPNP